MGFNPGRALKMCRRNDGSNTTASTQVTALRLHRSRMAGVNRQHTSALGSTDVGHRVTERESDSSRPSTTATTTPPVVGLMVSVDQLTAVVHADDGLGHQRRTLTAVDNATAAKLAEQQTAVDNADDGTTPLKA